MRWEKIRQEQVGLGESSSGPGKRWGHTCNAIKGGSFLYVFGGYGRDNCQTNQVHVFDAAKQIWTQPMINGTPPPPRDSHSCTTVGDNLFVFGGTDGLKPLNDLHILDTSSHTWKCPRVRGEGPEAREGHSATLVGKRIYVFGGCGKSSDSEIYYNDLYIFNTETFVWKRAVTMGNPPSARDSHSCSSWKNKIVVIGGEDEHDYYLSDVHILDTDTLIWKELNTSGQFLTPRAGHVTVSLGRNFFVFGGFSDAQNLYDDLYLLDIDTCVWSKVLTMGEGPCARFSSAGACLEPYKGGSLLIIGGCNKNLEALDDMFYLHTGLGYDAQYDQSVGKLSLKKQLKLRCQEQNHANSLYGGNYGWNTGQYIEGKMMFQARVTESYPVGYTVETMIDGKVLRGVLFSNKHSSVPATDMSFSGKRPAMTNGDQDNRSKISRTLIKDQPDAMEFKNSPSNAVEAGIETMSKPLDVNVNTVAVAPAAHETETAVAASEAKNQDSTQLDLGTVNTAGPSSVPQADEVSLEARNAVTIDDRVTKSGTAEEEQEKPVHLKQVGSN